jgi:hypothetical protein
MMCLIIYIDQSDQSDFYRSSELTQPKNFLQLLHNIKIEEISVYVCTEFSSSDEENSVLIYTFRL